MRPDKEFMLAKFQYFNKRYFKDSLPIPEILIVKVKSFLGQFSCSRKRLLNGSFETSNYRIKINEAYDLSESECEDILIHEMIHYFIAFHKIKDNSKHGHTFVELMNTINKNDGRNLKISYKGKQSTTLQPTKGKIYRICTSDLPNNEFGIAVCSIPAISRLLYFFKHNPQIKNVRWFRSFNTYFERLPAIRLPKLYLADKEAIFKELEDSVEFELVGNKFVPKGNE